MKFFFPSSHFTLWKFHSSKLLFKNTCWKHARFFSTFFHIVRRVSQQCSYHPPMDPISMFVKPLEKIHTSWKCLHFPILQSGFLYSLPQNFVVKGHFNEKSCENPTNKDFPNTIVLTHICKIILLPNQYLLNKFWQMIWANFPKVKNPFCYYRHADSLRVCWWPFKALFIICHTRGGVFLVWTANPVYTQQWWVKLLMIVLH